MASTTTTCRCTGEAEIYARSGVHLARSSMAQWVGICGVRLAPVASALREFILGIA
ncbi:MAG: transposase [Rubrivivax sp.]